MNSLLRVLDDGISGLVWAMRVRKQLKAGKRVIAVDDDKRGLGVIGTGDGLSSYEERGLTSFGGFSTVAIDRLDDPALFVALDSASADTTVAWNLDIFRPAHAVSGGREALMGRLATSPFDSLFCLYETDLEALDSRTRAHIKSLRMDSVAGRIVTRRFKDAAVLCDVVPQFRSTLESSGRSPCSPEATWQVLDSLGLRSYHCSYPRAENEQEKWEPVL
jgi:hypothetical protein